MQQATLIYFMVFPITHVFCELRVRLYNTKALGNL